MRIALLFLGLLALGIGGFVAVEGVPPAVKPWLAQQHWLAGLPGLATLALPSEAAPAAASARPPVPVVATIVRAEDVPIYLSGIGTVQAYNTVSVKTKIDGEIIQILFKEGQDVKIGDPLAVIDPRPYEAQLQQQKAAKQKDQALLDGALLDLARYQNLVLRDYASRQSVDQQKALVDQYRAQLMSDDAQIRYAETQLSYTRIVSPIDGRVGIRQVDSGNYLRASDGTTIVVITQLQPISAVFTLSAAAVAATHMTPGMAHFTVMAMANDDRTEIDKGTIDLVDNQVDQATGTIKVKASFPNAAIALWPGNFVNGRLVVDTRHDGLTVPSAAVRHGPRGDFVWLLHPNKTAETKAVVIGQVFDGRTLIERGVQRGDQVVLDGYYRLENGSPVEITRTEPAAPPAGGAQKPKPGPT
ncbi:MAG TPA: efflux RND transporter periplasmic adaptor subunit [Stellaceae bacterium]|nr:efflux RND transporter periplasmic adaptor subunit [Stellaceae bacterium]